MIRHTERWHPCPEAILFLEKKRNGLSFISNPEPLDRVIVWVSSIEAKLRSGLLHSLLWDTPYRTHTPWNDPSP